MIVGVGTDLVQISRIEAALGRHGDRFAARLLGPQEYSRFSSYAAAHSPQAARYLAKRFAAKEAIGKALGTGVSAPMAFHLAEVLNGPQGAPEVVCHGALAQHIHASGLRLHVSISDERDYAQAFAILEKP